MVLNMDAPGQTRNAGLQAEQDANNSRDCDIHNGVFFQFADCNEGNHKQDELYQVDQL